MIILILIIAAVCFIYFNVIPGKGHTPIAVLSLIILSLSVWGIVAHDYNHYGMTSQTKVETHQLASSVNPQLPILLYQPLGNGQEKIYLYKTDHLAKKLTQTSTENSSITVKSAKEPSVKIKTTRYVYKNKFASIMFGEFGHNNEIKHRTYIFNIPKDWKILSTKQLKALQKQVQAQQSNKIK